MRVLLLAAAISTSAVAADDVSPWKTVGGWQVIVDHTLSNGCFMFTIYEGGTALRIGFDRREDGNGYLMIGNEAWKSIDIGKEYPLTMRFDQEEPWQGDATAVDMDGLPMLMVGLTEVDFFAELMRKRGLAITYAGRQVAFLSLSASTLAMKEVLACQNAMDRVADEANADPFRDPAPAAPADPFQQR